MILTSPSIASPARMQSRPERDGITARRDLRPYGRGFALVQSAAALFVATLLFFIGFSDMTSAQTSSSNPTATRPLKLVAFGDSLTAGFCVNEYNIDVGGALVCGYEGISPNTIVNRTTVSSPDRGEEVPLDVLTAAQPAKLYILIGTNALVQPGNDDSFLAYYGKMLDELRTALPNTAFYVQSVLPATQEKAADSLPGLAPDRLAVINAAIQQLCAERGCYYLDLSAEFADDAGYLSTEFSQPDGVHLTVSGYSRWVSYLCTHVPYSKDNPYQAGSTYYLSEDMKGLLSDLP